MRSFPTFRVLAAVCVPLLCGSCSSDKPAFPVRTYQLGDRIDLGDVSYSVFETQWLTQIPQEPVPRVPQHRFFLIRLSAKNVSANDVVVPNATIEDDHGKSFDELSNGDGVSQWMGFLPHVKAAESAQGNMVFDAPPGHYKLRLSDPTGDRMALVEIPLSFGSETPEVPLPSEKK